MLGELSVGVLKVGVGRRLMEWLLMAQGGLVHQHRLIVSGAADAAAYYSAAVGVVVDPAAYHCAAAYHRAVVSYRRPAVVA